jgi:acyl-CoA hydrolase
LTFIILPAYFTFVALDDPLKSAEVPSAIPESGEEKRRYEEAEKRRQQRLKQAH